MLSSEGVMTEQAFATIWGLSYSDFEFLSRYGASSRVMVACQLLFFRQHGYFPEDRSAFDPDAIEYVADQIGIEDCLAYSFASDNARRQRAGILGFLGVRRASERDRAKLQAWMGKHLGGRDLNLADWVERGYAQACQMGVFVPSEKIMERLARASRRDFRKGFLAQVGLQLSVETIEQLEWALSEPLAETGFQRLKDDVGAASLDSVLRAALRVSFVEGLNLPLDILVGVERCWVSRLARQVEGETASEMRRHALERRLGLLASYLMHRKSQLTDGRIEDVIYPIAGAARLHAVIEEHRTKGTLDARIQQVMRNSYASHYRRILPPLLSSLQFRSNKAMWHPILTALDPIVRFAEADCRVVDEDDIPCGIIPGTWRSAVIDENGRVSVVSFELCVLTQLRERIRAKEIWIECADRYRNPGEDLPRDF
jgi:hypothetical protein